MARHRVNLNFSGGKRGEVLDIDPALWADEIDAGYLSPVDEHGAPVVLDEGTVSDLGDDDTG